MEEAWPVPAAAVVAVAAAAAASWLWGASRGRGRRRVHAVTAPGLACLKQWRTRKRWLQIDDADSITACRGRGAACCCTSTVVVIGRIIGHPHTLYTPFSRERLLEFRDCKLKPKTLRSAARSGQSIGNPCITACMHPGSAYGHTHTH